MYTQTMLHNREICSDQYKKMAVEVFHDLSGDQNAKLRSSIAKTQEGYFELYWAARAIHISHLNLIYQSWIIAGGTKEKYEKRYPGWANFAGLVALDLRTSEPSLQKKPFWYQKACEEIDFEFKDGSMYSKSFHEYMEMCRYEALQKRHQEEANKQTQVTLSPPTQQPQ
ncbi:MAG: hypothetical protein N4A65_00400 [Cohaesibacter sp.]|nr:hypothetical protein [Cohaesibacter sp.]